MLAISDIQGIDAFSRETTLTVPQLMHALHMMNHHDPVPATLSALIKAVYGKRRQVSGLRDADLDSLATFTTLQAQSVLVIYNGNQAKAEAISAILGELDAEFKRRKRQSNFAFIQMQRTIQRSVRMAKAGSV